MPHPSGFSFPFATPPQEGNPRFERRDWLPWLLCAWLGLGVLGLPAQDFSDQTSSAFQFTPASIDQGAAEWGDFDGDGYLDLIVTGDNAGTYQTNVYRFNPLTNTFQDYFNAINVPDVRNSDVAWGDYDNDGDLDILIAGEALFASAPITAVYYYDQNTGEFKEDATATPALEGLRNANVAWVDYDRDGDLDVAISGFNGSSRRFSLYRNEGGSDFQPDTSLVGVEYGSMDWADWDNDGYPDLVYTGNTSASFGTTKLYRNVRGTSFQSITTNLPYLLNGSVAWGDYDNDDQQDVLLTGRLSGGTRIAEVYVKNATDNFFTAQSAGLTGIERGEAIWGDYDNDGYLDIMLSGQTNTAGTARISELHRNNGGSNFVLQTTTSAVFEAVGNYADLAFGDYDDDQKLDILMIGDNVGNGTGATLKVYRNTEATANTTAGPPQLINAVQNQDTVTLNWNPPAGYSAALVDGLTYNYYVGTSIGDDDVSAAEADLNTGERFIVRQGKTNHTNQVIVGLAPGNYRWNIQAIEPDFEGGSWPVASGSLTVSALPGSPPIFSNTTADVFGIAPPGISEGALAWGDVDNDGDLDCLFAGLASDDVPGSPDVRTSLYTNDGGTFSFNPLGNNLPEVYRSDLAFSDFNNDGILDLAICGLLATNSRIFQIWRGLGTGAFVNVSINNGDAAIDGSIDWGDYDGDGDMDILLTGIGSVGSAPITKIFENNWIPSNNLSFTYDAAASAGLDPIKLGEGKFADLNLDGFTDIVLVGDNNGVNIARRYLNNGDGTFTNDLNLPSNLKSASVDIHDTNNDGFPDILVNGIPTSGTDPQTLTLVYLPANNLYLPTGSLVGSQDGKVAWGDYDNDGWIDLLYTGTEKNSGGSLVPTTRLYRNNANPGSVTNPFLTGFTEQPPLMTGLPALEGNSDLAWGDYDGDGKLDVLIAGETSQGGRVVKLLHNDNAGINRRPNAPQQLASTLNGFEVILDWKAPLANPGIDSASVHGGFSYTLFVMQPNGDLLKTPLSDTTSGYRLLTEAGKQYHTTSDTLTNLTPGTYRWWVQAIDQDFEGGDLPVVQTFDYEDPTFVDQGSAIFNGAFPEGLYDGHAAWADFSGDGYLDFVVTGQGTTTPRTELYQYDAGQGRYTLNAAFSNQLTNLRNSYAAWADYDHDGDMDLALMGENAAGTPLTEIYENLGPGFLAGNKITLTGHRDGQLAWGDYDNDGWDDLVVTGNSSSGAGTTVSTLLYHNDQGTGFSVVAAPGFLNLTQSAAAWGDINQDGYLDLVLSGSPGSGSAIRFYFNNQDGTFSQVAVAGVTGAILADLDMADFNADGLLDILLTGADGAGNNALIRILQNNGDSTFSTTSLPTGGVDGSGQFGDYNNDGYADILLSGRDTNLTTGSRGVNIFRFDPISGQFVAEDLAAQPFQPVDEGSTAAWGDYDQDGKLDVLLMGRTADSPDQGTVRIYKNIEPTAPSAPGMPANLTAEIKGYEVRLSWDAPAATPASIVKGLSYSVYVGNVPDSIDQRSPGARLTDGRRLLVARGVVGDTVRFKLANLPAGTYNWSVQAIDADLEGGPFAAASTFEYEPPIFLEDTRIALGNLPAGVEQGTLVFGDVDANGALDLLVLGHATTGPLTRLFVNQGNGTLAPLASGLPDLEAAAAAWADIDADGDLDLALMGLDNGGTRVTDIYTNDGSGAFTALAFGLPAVAEGSLAWGDIDYDGDPDLLLSGSDGSTPQTQVWQNLGANQFAALGLGLTAVSGGSVSWEDVNLDGWVDILATGTDNAGQPLTTLYLNDGNLGMNAANAGLPFVSAGAHDWGDVNQDSLPDLVLSGADINAQALTQLFLNDGDGSFTLSPQSLPGIQQGDVRLGDYNDDNILDLVLAGAAGAGNVAHFFEGQGNAVFSPQVIGSLPLRAVDMASLAWGDYTQDQKLDLALMGVDADGPTLRLLRNVEPTPNIVPTLLGLATPTSFGDTVFLAWNGAANNAETFNLAIGTSSGATDILDPLAANDGLRQIAARGNMGGNHEFRLGGLADGTYFWKVQRIGPDYEGSAFSVEGSFTYTQPLLIDESSLGLSTGGIEGLAEGDLAWGDYDDDGDLDLLLSGEIVTGFGRTAILRNANGVLTLDNNASDDLPNLLYSQVAWLDFNQDGALDVYVTGENNTTGGPGTGTLANGVYLNDGAGRFNLSSAADAVPALTQAAVDIADVDHDGKPDLLLAGQSATGAFSGLFIQSEGKWELVEGVDLPALTEPALALGDYDQDGFIDFVIAGNNSGQALTRLYRNRGVAGGFTLVAAPFPALENGGFAWADVEGDGDLDLALSGLNIGGNAISNLFLYNAGTGQFTAQGDNFSGFQGSAPQIADINDDDLPDLLFTGENTSGVSGSVVYLNQGGAAFTLDNNSSLSLRGAGSGGDAAWGDYDGDGKLDLALMGGHLAATRDIILYRNTDESPNNTPAAPTAGFSVTPAADEVIFSWDASAGASNYSYNLMVGTADGGVDIVSPLSQLPTENNGFRQVSEDGNAGYTLSYRLEGLAAGTYHWRVQAIGQDLEASPFSANQVFTFEPSHFVPTNISLFDTVAIASGTNGDLAWVDYDLDGDLDLAVAATDGTATFTLYNNLRGERLIRDQAAIAAIAPTANASMVWQDFDLDGQPDLLLTGEQGGSPSAIIYRNNNGVFTAAGSGLTGLLSGTAAWADINQDGAPDIMLTGETTGNAPEVSLWINDGRANFSAAAANFPQWNASAQAWADWNRDGRADLVLAGDDNGSPAITVFLNQGEDQFIRLNGAFPAGSGLSAPELSIGELNNDGYPDVLLTGSEGASPALRIFRNLGNSQTNLLTPPVPLDQLAGIQGQWADYNEDGWQDLALMGRDVNGQTRSVIYRNLKNLSFAYDTLATREIIGISDGNMAWGDYDGDQKLDVALIGQDASDVASLRVYRNNEPTPNATPDLPTALKEEVVGNTVILRWERPGIADSVLESGYSYNLFMAIEGNGRVIPALADTLGANDGWRRIAATGNAHQGYAWTIEDLQEGLTYRWGVQAIGADLEPSAFAWSEFSFTPPAFDDVSDDLFPGGRPTGVINSALLLGDYDNDGDLDLVASGELSLSQSQTAAYRFENGQFQLDSANSEAFPDLSLSNMAWGDYDGDNDLDLLISGQTLAQESLTQIFVNDSGRFSLDPIASDNLPGLIRASADWGDYDNDGDVDILLAGLAGSAGTPVTEVYTNVGDGTFVQDMELSALLPGVSNGQVLWGDYDTDGDLDIVVSGDNGVGGITQIFRQAGDGSFAFRDELAQVRFSSIAWGDLFNLGVYDLVVAGENSETQSPFSRFYHYDPATEQFIADTTLDLLPAYQGYVGFADYDNDGFSDLLISGRTGSNPTDRATKLYRNTRDGGLEEDLLTSRDLIDVDLGAVAWGDYDADGKLDIFITGRTASNPPAQTFSVFRNIDSVQNTRPAPPEVANASVFGPRVTLRWNAPQGVPFDRVNGLTYNLYLAPLNNDVAVQTPLAALPNTAEDGYRRMVYYGNVGHTNSWTIKTLPDGEYVWAVQTVDPDFEGSRFSETGSFSFANPVPEITNVSVPELYPDDTDLVNASIAIQVDTVVDDVLVVFRGIGADSTGWDSISLGNTGLTYSFDINLDRIDEMGLQYLFKVKGRFGFDAVTDTLHTYRYYASGFAYNTLTIGEEVTAYNIIGIPLQLEERRIVEVIEPSFGTYDIFEWRMFHYANDTIQEFKQDLTQLQTPKGYWIITKEARTFNSGPGRVVEANSHQPYEIALQTGWNQISDPLPYDIYWSDVRAANDAEFDAVVTQLLQFNGGFQAADRVEVNEGAFVFATQPYTLRIPVTKNPAVGRRGRIQPPVAQGGLDEERWQLPIFAAQGKQLYELAAIGMQPEASDDMDRFDGRRAPRLADYMDVTIGQHAEPLSRDIVPTQEGYIWDLTVRAYQKGLPVTLRWDREWVANSRRQLVLFDVDRQLIIPMHERDSYDAWGEESSRNFRVYMGDPAFIARQLQPDWVHLGLAYPNPATDVVRIPFSLPPAATPYEVEVEILTLDGKLIRTLTKASFKPGFHTLVWDTRNNEGGSIAAGMYVYRLQVKGLENYWQENRKLMVE